MLVTKVKSGGKVVLYHGGERAEFMVTIRRNEVCVSMDAPRTFQLIRPGGRHPRLTVGPEPDRAA